MDRPALHMYSKVFWKFYVSVCSREFFDKGYLTGVLSFSFSVCVSDGVQSSGGQPGLGGPLAPGPGQEMAMVGGVAHAVGAVASALGTLSAHAQPPPHAWPPLQHTPQGELALPAPAVAVSVLGALRRPPLSRLRPI